MSHRSSRKWIEGSDYEDKCSQQADDVERMSNREKRKDKSKKKRIGVNRNITPLLSPRQRQGYLRTHKCCTWVHRQGCPTLHWSLHHQRKSGMRNGCDEPKKYER